MKIFSTLIVLLIGSILGFFTGALLTSNVELEAEKEQWQIKISELEKRLESQLARISEKVTSEVSHVVSKRMGDLVVREELFEAKIVQLPKLVSQEVSSMFPLEVKELGDGIQLTTAKIPEELSVFLDNLSEFTANKITPSDEVAETRQRIGSIVNQLSPLRRQMIADDIELAEWSLNALDILSGDQSSEDLLIHLVLAQSLIETVPNNASKQLANAVVDYSGSKVELATSQIRSLAESSPSPDLASLRSGLLLADWMSQAGLLADSAPLDKIEVQLQTREWLDAKQRIKRESFYTKEEYDVARHAIFEDGSVIMESAVNRRVALPDGFVEVLKGFSKELVEEQREAQRRQHAEYQLWAISNISEASKLIADSGSDLIGKWLKEAKDFPENSHFTLLTYLEEEHSPKFRLALLETVYAGKIIPGKVTKYRLPEIVEELDVMTGWKNQSGMAQALTADALIQHLLVIDEAYLDRPVAAIYGDAFQKAWTYLEGTDQRIDVSKVGATVTKRTPGESLLD